VQEIEVAAHSRESTFPSFCLSSEDGNSIQDLASSFVFYTILQAACLSRRSLQAKPEAAKQYPSGPSKFALRKSSG